MFASLSKLHFLRYLHFDRALERAISMLRMDGKMRAWSPKNCRFRSC